MSTPRTYQLVRRGDQYAVRYKGWFDLWIYLNSGCGPQLTPAWMSRILAEDVIFRRKRDESKGGDVEVVSEL